MRMLLSGIWVARPLAAPVAASGLGSELTTWTP
jgi:hypothetical protein